MANTNCPFCGFPVLSDDHVFNLDCALSNAENDQVVAEVAEAMRQPRDPDVEDNALEVALETLAYMRFIRDLTKR